MRIWSNGRIASLVTLAVAAVLVLADEQRGRGQDFEVRQTLKTNILFERSCLAFSPDGKMLVVADGSWRGMLVWDLEKRKERVFVDKQGKEVTWGISCAAFSPNGDTLALGGFGSIYLLDVAAGKEKDIIVPGIKKQTCSMVFALDGKMLTASFRDSAILWDLVLRCEKSRISDISYAAIAPGCKTLASIWSEHGVRIWALDSGKERALLESKEDPGVICPLRFAPDGNTLAAPGAGSTVYLWDVKRKEQTAILTHPHRVSLQAALAFSPDSRTLAVVDYDGAIHLWEIASRCQRAILRSKQKNIAPLAFSPDGQTLAAGCSQDGHYSVKLWDLLSIKRKPPDAEEMVRLWAGLRDKDAADAYSAIRTLTAFPAQTLPLLRKQLLPMSTTAEESRNLASLIADLDSDDFATREKAYKKLEAAGLRAEEALRHALAKSPSLEVRRRGLKLLDSIERKKKIEPIQQLRALEVLEHIGTAEARAVLQDLAKGVPEARLTQEAKASLARLAKRPASKP